jgi:alkylation response protein AidB-like acyl-CoA dehydrogenase
MGIRGINVAELVLEDCRVSRENLLGEPGQGFKLALSGVNKARLDVGAEGVGLAQGALDYALDYAKQRVQFGRPIVEFQGVSFMLAEMATQIEAARALTYKAARMFDQDHPGLIKAAAMVKCFASDMAMRVTTDAVQVLGGYGYMKDHPLERMMRDAKILQIYDGTNQIQRLVISKELIKGRG